MPPGRRRATYRGRMAAIELLRELNSDLWRPFRAAYRARDAAAFLALHTPDLIRVNGTAGTVHGLSTYAARIEPRFAGLAARNDAVDIAFRFTERVADGDLASERGVYRLVIEPIGGDRLTYYGRFHTFARKVGGTWRIAVDYVTDATFEAAAALDDVDRFAS
jgi:ketosteroid isomerase-like protein